MNADQARLAVVDYLSLCRAWRLKPSEGMAVKITWCGGKPGSGERADGEAMVREAYRAATGRQEENP